MIRTVISLEREDKVWLDRKTKERQISMAELVREAVHQYRVESEKDPESLELLLDKTSGIWKGEDGLAYQRRLREQWKLPDALQAAAASYHGLELVTRNTTDFPSERFPFVTVPYEL